MALVAAPAPREHPQTASCTSDGVCGGLCCVAERWCGRARLLQRARAHRSLSAGVSAPQLINESTETADMEHAGHPSSETPTATNYFLQYISSRYVSGALRPALCRVSPSLRGAQVIHPP